MPGPYDEIGYWSEIKLDIVREYAAAYSRIMSARRDPTFHHIYIDAFAGGGLHISKQSGEFIPGSPLNALLVQPSFREYHFVDLDKQKVDSLKKLAGERNDVQVYEGDCNDVLLIDVFPRARYDAYRRALCLLDPYGLHLNWEVMETAGRMKSIELFLNFPIMDMNMNVLRRNPDNADPNQLKRMNAFWGDVTWREAAYETHGNLFGFPEKTGNERVVEAFRQRLQSVAGFKYVPDPLSMRNSTGAVVYYLFFASQKPVAQEIVSDIFDKYRDRGLQ